MKRELSVNLRQPPLPYLIREYPYKYICHWETEKAYLYVYLKRYTDHQPGDLPFDVIYFTKKFSFWASGKAMDL